MFSDINDFSPAFDGLVMWFRLGVYFNLIYCLSLPSFRVKLAQPLRPWMEPRIVRAVSSSSNGLVSTVVKDDSFVLLPGLLAPPSSHASVKRTQTMPSRSRDSSPLVVPRPDRKEESKYL